MSVALHIKDGWERLDQPGRYLVYRSFEADGMLYGHEMECNNPAYGVNQLDEWQDVVLRRIESKRKMAA